MIRRSASQIATFRLCGMRWWISQFVHIPENPNEQNARGFGKRMHKQLEDWCRDRKPLNLSTNEGKAAIQGLPFLPEHPWLVEHWFEFDFGGVRYRGKIDLVWGSQHVVIFTDHKSIGTLERRMTAEQLAKNPQQIIYAYWIHLTFELPSVAHWQYYRRSKPKSLPVITRGTPENMQELHDSCDGMVLWPPPARNVNACDLYPPEGCPYRHICKPDRANHTLEAIANA